jgi:hypothetical protein
MSSPVVPSWFTFNFPSGDVAQSFGSAFFSPQFEVNYAGVPSVEREIISDVASFGKQLGILSEAILEITDGGAGDKVERLRRLVCEVEAVKKRHKRDLQIEAEDALRRLKVADPSAFKSLVARLAE